MTLEFGHLPGMLDGVVPVSKDAICSLLVASRDLITEKGFWRFSADNRPDAWPMPDAIIAAYLVPFCGHAHDGDKRVLVAAIDRYAEVIGVTPSGIAGWGDAHTEDEIVAAFERAIGATNS